MAVDIRAGSVVKTADPASTQRECIALTHLGPGVVDVLEYGEGVLSLERIRPGHALRESIRNDDDVHEIIGRLILELQEIQPSGSLRPVELPLLAEVLTPLHRMSNGRLPDHLTQRALAMGRELATDDTVVPLVVHGDLHAGNILWDSGRERWRVIDPHGWVGDPVFEAVVSLCEPQGLGVIGDARGCDPVPLVARLNRRLSILCEITGFERERLESWAFVGAVIAEARMLVHHDLVHGAPLALAEGLLDRGAR